MQTEHNLNDVGYFNPYKLKWILVSWFIQNKFGWYVWRKTTKGYYYRTDWHPFSVEQSAYVMDDFGDLVLVYKYRGY